MRGVLPAIRVPTLVLHRAGNRFIDVRHGRYLADHIPGAKFVEIPGEDHLFHVGQTETMLDEVEEFLTGMRPVPEVDRVLATVLFTDIVGSTERLAAFGDRAWRALLDAHHEIVRTLGIEIRAGLHTGEVELAGAAVRGIAVHIGARVAGEAGAGEVLVSSTVKDLVAGSGIRFTDRGLHVLKGVPGDWRLFAAEDPRTA
jgi:class 3 adenylate cyclase